MTDLIIAEGYVPGLLGRVAGMHGVYYAREHGFGSEFEGKVATEVAAFLGRLEAPENALFRAESGGRIVGSVTIDGQDLGGGIAHLRWFIMDDGARGLGAGRRLMAAAMDFAAKREVHLWTFRGLDAARRLYEDFGFSLVDEQAGSQWGTEVMEQKFVRPGG